jgi:hypothetical protein
VGQIDLTTSSIPFWIHSLASLASLFGFIRSHRSHLASRLSVVCSVYVTMAIICLSHNNLLLHYLQNRHGTSTMSDLAPFVAAALRDKVINDLMEENQAIRKQLQQARRVEITGPGGAPVYAHAQFDDDGDYDDNPNLWNVKFPEGKQLLSCPLSALDGIEIRVGGILKAQFAGRHSNFDAYLDENDADHAMGKAVNVFFAGASSLWLIMLVNGWPERQWQETIREDLDSPDLLDHLIETVATEPPEDKTITFLEVAFVNKGVRGAIDALGLSPSRQETQEDAE